AQWLAAPVDWAADLFKELADRLTAVDISGTTCQLSSGDGDPPTKRAGGVRLLPYFDSYVIGSRPRAEIYPGPVADRALSRGQAGTVPVVLVNGVVGGVWHHRRAGRTVHITVEMLRDLNRRQRGLLSDQIDRTAEILEATPSLTFGPVPVGRHL
ncbi:MAG: crosslink repair DNA glycosylase YcaQ family protein, partial [Nakamurella sp.]